MPRKPEQPAAKLQRQPQHPHIRLMPHGEDEEDGEQEVEDDEVEEDPVDVMLVSQVGEDRHQEM